MVQDYVAGFLFSQDGTSVGLIRKNHPEWQSGKLNAIGGKVENGEAYSKAMEREFLEETGVLIQENRWKIFCHMIGDNFNVYFYMTKSGSSLKRMRRITDEEPLIVHIEDIGLYDIVPQVDWLIPMALDKDIKNMVKVYV